MMTDKHAYDLLMEVLEDGPGMSAFPTVEEGLRAAAKVYDDTCDPDADFTGAELLAKALAYLAGWQAP